MIKHLIVIGSLLVATLLGIFGQPLAYFFDDYISKEYPIYYLTMFTYISVSLYVFAFVYNYVQKRNNRFSQPLFNTYFFTLLLVALPTSLWSLFVLAMWWG